MSDWGASLGTSLVVQQLLMLQISAGKGAAFVECFRFIKSCQVNSGHMELLSDSDMCMYMGVSKNNGTPKSSILIGFSIKTIYFGVPLFLETPIYTITKSFEELTLRPPLKTLCAVSIPVYRCAFGHNLKFHVMRPFMVGSPRDSIGFQTEVQPKILIHGRSFFNGRLCKLGDPRVRFCQRKGWVDHGESSLRLVLFEINKFFGSLTKIKNRLCKELRNHA